MDFDSENINKLSNVHCVCAIILIFDMEILSNIVTRELLPSHTQVHFHNGKKRLLWNQLLNKLIVMKDIITELISNYERGIFMDFTTL